MAAALTVVALIASACDGGSRRNAGGGASPAPTASGDASPAPAGTATAPPTDATAIRTLLARRARTLQARDPSALAATATGAAQRARDRRMARRAAAVPLRGVAYAVREIELRGSSHATVRATVGYRVSGANGTFAVNRRIDALRTKAGWRVSRDAPSGRERAPWEVVGLRARRTRHFVVLAPRGAAPGLPAALEAARARMRSALGGVDVPDGLLVLVAADASQAQRLTSSIRGVETLAAIADASVEEAGPGERVVAVHGQRMIVVATAWAALDEAGRRRVLTHELTHAALIPRTSGRTPAWLLEGVALYASGDDRRAQAGRLLAGDALAGASAATRRDVARTTSLRALASPRAIGRRSGLAQSAAYAYASAAAYTIAGRDGRAKLLDLYDVFGDDDLTGEAGAALQDRAIRRVLGISAATLGAEIEAATRR